MHAAAVYTDEDGLHYAMCECGWRLGPQVDRNDLRRQADLHTDPEVLDTYVYETQLNYPHLTREQILNYDDTNS
jgi:hypothetical protein